MVVAQILLVRDPRQPSCQSSRNQDDGVTLAGTVILENSRLRGQPPCRAEDRITSASQETLCGADESVAVVNYPLAGIDTVPLCFSSAEQVAIIEQRSGPGHIDVLRLSS